MRHHPTSRRAALGLIFGTIFLDLVGFGIVIPVLPLYAERFGASPLTIGLLLGSYSAMQCLCAPLLGRLSDRVGRRPVLLLSVIGTALGFLLMGLAHALWLLFVARLIDGATGGNISTAQAYIADITPPERRSHGMGLIGAAFGLGFIFGPAIGGVLSHVSLAAPFLFAAALAGINALAIYVLLPESLSPEHRARPHHRASIAEVFRQSTATSLRAVLATYFLVTVAFSLLTATYPLFTERRFGYSAAENGYLFAGQGLLSAIVQGGLLGLLLKRFGEKTLVMAGAVALTVGMMVLPLSGTTMALLLTTAGLAVGHGLVAAPLNGLASKSVASEAQGRVLGVMQAAASFARIVGPVLGGWLLNIDTVHLTAQFGKTPYWASAGITLVAVGFALAL